jgi:hypothetical protein
MVAFPPGTYAMERDHVVSDRRPDPPATPERATPRTASLRAVQIPRGSGDDATLPVGSVVSRSRPRDRADARAIALRGRAYGGSRRHDNVHDVHIGCRVLPQEFAYSRIHRFADAMELNHVRIALHRIHSRSCAHPLH